MVEGVDGLELNRPGERDKDVDGQGLRWWVEAICAQLAKLGCKIAPATYYEHRSRARRPRRSCGTPT